MEFDAALKLDRVDEVVVADSVGLGEIVNDLVLLVKREAKEAIVGSADPLLRANGCLLVEIEVHKVFASVGAEHPTVLAARARFFGGCAGRCEHEDCGRCSGHFSKPTCRL